MLLFAALLLLGVASIVSSGSSSHELSITKPLTQPRSVTRRQRSAPTGSTVHKPAVGSAATPRRAAIVFVRGWLGCTYGQSPCKDIRDMVPAYSVALSQEDDRSQITPAEHSARLRVVALRVVRSCARAAIAVASYADDEAGIFQLHISLVRSRAGWLAFDVAEAAPHIALPAPLTQTSRGC
jgi:hypothetical protein